VTAVRDVSVADLEPVDAVDLERRFSAEATRMAEEHDPHDTV
jgi:hypothetical protein